MGVHAVDITGHRFGDLEVVEQVAAPEKGRGPMWLCRCDCGRAVEVWGRSLRRGERKACGLDGHRFGRSSS